MGWWHDSKRNLALRAGVMLDKRTDAGKLQNLIRDLRPTVSASKLVRIGAKGDGGYLVPDDLDGIAACLSPGVSTECGFDLAMAERGIDVFMADASVDGPPLDHPRFHFTPHFIDAVADNKSITFEAFSAIADAHHSGGDRLLQMDIEGAEWRVLLSAPMQELARCRIMIVEFHDLHRLFSAPHFDIMASVFRRILAQFEVAHIHPNNAAKTATVGNIAIPRLLEITFYRRDRISAADAAGARTYPHPLDHDCAPGKPTLTLPKIWW